MPESAVVDVREPQAVDTRPPAPDGKHKVTKRVALALVILGVFAGAILFQVMRVTEQHPEVSSTHHKFTPLKYLSPDGPSADQIALRSNLTMSMQAGLVRLTDMFATVESTQGAVTRAVFDDALQAFLHVNPGLEQVAAGDGIMGKIMTAYFSSLERATLSSDVVFGTLFHFMDANDDGVISAQEVQHVQDTNERIFRSMGDAGVAFIAFRVIDANHDRLVERRQEFIPFAADAMRMTVSWVQQEVDAMLEALEETSDQILNVVGLLEGDSWTHDHAMMPIDPATAAQSQQAYLMSAAGVVMSVPQLSNTSAVDAWLESAFVDGPLALDDLAASIRSDVDAFATAWAMTIPQLVGVIRSVVPLPGIMAGVWPQPSLSQIDTLEVMNAQHVVLEFVKNNALEFVSSLMQIADSNDDDKLSREEVEPWVNVLKAIMPTAKDVATIQAQMQMHADMQAQMQGGMAPAQGDGAMPSRRVQEVMKPEDSHLGQFVSALFTAISGPDGSLTHDEAKAFMLHLGDAVAFSSHVLLDVADKELSTMLELALAILWPETGVSARKGAITFAEANTALNVLMTGQIAPPPGPPVAATSQLDDGAGADDDDDDDDEDDD